MKYDVLVLGAGAVGAMIARNLSRYELKVAVLEKENDVGNVTSMANSAIVHSGYDPVPGTNKAKFNVLGNKMFDEIADDLDVHFSRCGSLTVALYDEQLKILDDLAKRSKENGVEVKILSKEELLAMEPNINPEAKGALFAPTAGIIDPFNLVVHAMENAVDNGVELYLNEEVVDIKKDNQDIKVITRSGKEYIAKIVINATGLASEKITNLVEETDWHITPRKGEYFVLDHYKRGLVNHTIFPLPSEKGKGILVTMTTSNNYLCGPSSESINELDDFSCDGPTLANVRASALEMVPSIPFNQAIRCFAGLRATCTRHDFVIEFAKTLPNFIILGGIESPGLVSSPAIGKYVVEEMVGKLVELKEKSNYNPRVKRYIRPKELSLEERNELIKNNPTYAHILCSCEQVSEGEMLDALSRSVPPRSVKAMKKRVRAGFGKCQGGFCQPHVVNLLAKHYHLSPLDIPYDSINSKIIIARLKEGK